MGVSQSIKWAAKRRQRPGRTTINWINSQQLKQRRVQKERNRSWIFEIEYAYSWCFPEKNIKKCPSTKSQSKAALNSARRRLPDKRQTKPMRTGRSHASCAKQKEVAWNLGQAQSTDKASQTSWKTRWETLPETRERQGHRGGHSIPAKTETLRKHWDNSKNCLGKTTTNEEICKNWKHVQKDVKNNA